MRKRTIVILVIIVALLIAGIYGWNEYNRVSKSLADVTPAVTVDAPGLIREFETGDAGVEKKYLGKVLQVKGNIRQVEKDADGNFTIVLGDAGEMSAVRCSMDTTTNDRLQSIKQGTTVNIKGIFTGFEKDETGLLGSDIKLNRAVIK